MERQERDGTWSVSRSCGASVVHITPADHPTRGRSSVRRTDAEHARACADRLNALYFGAVG
jgi:hypothetical protein